MNEGIAAQAYPGCEVLVAVDGQVVLNKAYGHSTYAKTRRYAPMISTIWRPSPRWPSTTLALMKLVDEG